MSEERNGTEERNWAPEMREWLESGEAYRLFIESFEDFACLILDPEGRVASWNPGAERIFGYQAAEILGRPGAVLFTPEDRRDGVPEQELELAATKGRASDDRWQMRKDGTPFFANGVSISLRDDQGVLLNNAAKYTADGGSILLAAEVRDGQALVLVGDTGMGIAPDLLPSVFDPFIQGSRSLDRSEGGLGIGLTLVRKLVEMHGGAIEARSQGLGQGSEFLIRLPVMNRGSVFEPEAPLVTVPGAAGAAKSGAAEPLPLRVLVVDDNVDTVESLSILLEMAGHEVRSAHSGPDAIEAATAFSPHAVLLDIGLPGLSGYEVARRLRDNPRLAGAALIAVSGYGQDEDRHRSKEAGFDRHLLKPLDFAELQKLLATIAAR